MPPKIVRPSRAVLAALVAVGCAGLAALLTALPASALFWKDSLRRVAEAEAKGDARSAFDEALILALAGESAGYDLLAGYYRSGKGVPANAERAAQITCIAAERGSETAQTRLAALYAEGAGLPASPDRAWFWAEVAGRKMFAPLRDTSGLTAIQQAAAPAIPAARLADLRQQAAAWKPATIGADNPAQRYGVYCP